MPQEAQVENVTASPDSTTIKAGESAASSPGEGTTATAIPTNWRDEFDFKGDEEHGKEAGEKGPGPEEAGGEEAERGEETQEEVQEGQEVEAREKGAQRAPAGFTKEEVAAFNEYTAALEELPEELQGKARSLLEGVVRMEGNREKLLSKTVNEVKALKQFAEDPSTIYLVEYARKNPEAAKVVGQFLASHAEAVKAGDKEAIKTALTKMGAEAGPGQGSQDTQAKAQLNLDPATVEALKGLKGKSKEEFRDLVWEKPEELMGILDVALSLNDRLGEISRTVESLTGTVGKYQKLQDEMAVFEDRLKNLPPELRTVSFIGTIREEWDKPPEENEPQRTDLERFDLAVERAKARMQTAKARKDGETAEKERQQAAKRKGLSPTGTRPGPKQDEEDAFFEDRWGRGPVK